jgi:transcriptional regulator with XRE-family HTH domain
VPPQAVDPALAKVLRRLREAEGVSQQAIAERAGLTVGAYARIEIGKSGPTWVTVRTIAPALGLSLAELAALVEAEGE